MNITDLDDKVCFQSSVSSHPRATRSQALIPPPSPPQIILKARRNYLFEQYIDKNPSLQQVVADVSEARDVLKAKLTNMSPEKREMNEKLLVRPRGCRHTSGQSIAVVSLLAKLLFALISLFSLFYVFFSHQNNNNIPGQA